MSTLRDLAATAGDLAEEDIDWLHALLAEWQLLADLSFSDLLLWIRVRGAHEAAGSFLAVAQVRPATGPTAYPDDLVGDLAPARDSELLATAWAERRVVRDDDGRLGGRAVRREAVPVRTPGGVVAAVMVRATDPSFARTPSELELTYLDAAGELMRMTAEGRFPYPEADANPEWESGPRVGDGLARLDGSGRVTYASPNALSAYRRLGVTGNLLGKHLGDLTAALVADAGVVGDPQVGAVLRARVPREAELELDGAFIQLRALPLLPGGRVRGALVLVRDVTEVRRRDRALVSKDATIREIHHRVKNNLQTVAALLRLQSRRLVSPEARAALEESVRRVSSIALVHETLSLGLDERVAFDDITRQLATMVGDLSLSGAPVRIELAGTFGVLPATVATPLALVLTELLQNAVEHAFLARAGRVRIIAERGPDRLSVEVEDDGRGMPAEFRLDTSPRLGLQIVRTLVESELFGTIQLDSRPGGGTTATLVLPLRGADSRG